MKVNILGVQDNDFKVFLDRAGTTIKVNNIETEAIISNTPMNELDDKYVSTITELKRGDHIIYNGKDYYVINQVKTKRYESYKAIIRCAEHYIKFNLSIKDRENYKYVAYDIKQVPCIVQTTTDFGLDEGKQVVLAEGELALFVQDNATTRAIYKSFTDIITKHDIIIDNRQYEYTGFDFIKKGLVRINVKVTSTSNPNDKDIAWETNLNHSDYDGTVDDSFYNNDGIEPPEEPEEPPVEPEEPADPNRTFTDVGTITYTTVPATDDVADGQITFNWIADPLATQGYNVRLKIENYFDIVREVEVTDTTITFTNLEATGGANDYVVEISSKSDEGYLISQVLGDVYLPKDSGWGDGWGS
ncbi:hypothetical protein MKY04_11935 [Lysinibacillus telephonicus]|uniref:hypothetical protein n=1 Tax=Lysinibacillus telephonicus TaxID=1714840 RepID=UPI0031FCCBB7